MKKRILSILLLCCMVLTLLPTAAFAAGKIWVGTEEELLAALADNTIDKITLTADITVSQTLVIDRQVVLVLDHSLKIDREQSSSGTLFHITKSGYLDTDAGSITDNVLNEGRFYPPPNFRRGDKRGRNHPRLVFRQGEESRLHQQRLFSG